MHALSPAGERCRDIDHRSSAYSRVAGGCSSHHNYIPGSGRNLFVWVVTSQSASKLQPSVDMEDVADAYDPPSARDTVDPQAALCARVFLERDMITPLKEGLE
jgi:hypothetical protein